MLILLIFFCFYYLATFDASFVVFVAFASWCLCFTSLVPSRWAVIILSDHLVTFLTPGYSSATFQQRLQVNFKVLKVPRICRLNRGIKNIFWEVTFDENFICVNINYHQPSSVLERLIWWWKSVWCIKITRCFIRCVLTLKTQHVADFILIYSIMIAVAIVILYLYCFW